MSRLFDDMERTDPTPARHQEGSFDFLNRVSTSWWAALRNTLESWFAAYCDDADAEKIADLRSRFRKRDARQHLGAWWKLYVYWLLRSLHSDRQILIEPPRASATTRPDFCLVDAAGRVELWVEAVTTFSGIVDSRRDAAREAFVLDTLNEVESAEFLVWIKSLRAGNTQPNKRELQQPLRVWLRTLDYSAVVLQMQRREPRPRITLTPRGWQIVLEAMPKRRRGTSPSDRLVGAGPMTSGFVNDEAEARKAIVSKAGRYGELDAPFVIALMPSSPFFKHEDAMNALFGSEAVRFDLDDPDAAELHSPRGRGMV